MTIEEYREIVSGMTPENYQTEVLKLLDSLQQDLTTLDSLSVELEQAQNKISELRDVNMQLYLRTTEAITEEEEDEEPDFDELASRIGG